VIAEKNQELGKGRVIEENRKRIDLSTSLYLLFLFHFVWVND
jgi:hypothetical protein